MAGPHPLAGKPAPAAVLVHVPRLITAYYTTRPDPAVAEQRVRFGTSGHRGSSLGGAFNEAHILATTRAICEYRAREGITGPLFLGADTHALSEPALATALEVLAAEGVSTVLDESGGPVATPVISHAILAANRDARAPRADGIVVTPSHNPPEDGGFKYNPPHGGPAGGEVTAAIEQRANELLATPAAIRRVSLRDALRAATTRRADLIGAYVSDLSGAIDVEAIRRAGIRIGVDPLGGAGLPVAELLAERLALAVEVVDRTVDPSFRFMTLDHDGKIRMDCSSPDAMARLVALRDRYDVAFGNDCDADRHGIVTRSSGLLPPNHYLAVAIDHLSRTRGAWRPDAAIGKTLVSSSLIDRVAASVGRPLAEVPVGFKWFVPGLLDGTMAFGGEESAGASFLRRDGSTWTTDKDGILLGLLAAEICAVRGKDPGELYRGLVAELGEPLYARVDAPATPAEKARLARLDRTAVTARTLGGEAIREVLTHAPYGGAAIGGLKVVAESGWFAARPSGTEDVYKIYAESFRGAEHLAAIQAEAKELVGAALRG
ncbi:MAG: alpha-D-glucose phosphate-specific phosphoglucomutase [Deltaproteobacteria bacterium]|nr:alpha-D-glucose phosphate-specific phosphoglucomutase [Deltaproteobacteria bacterium]